MGGSASPHKLFNLYAFYLNKYGNQLQVWSIGRIASISIGSKGNINFNFRGHCPSKFMRSNNLRPSAIWPSHSLQWSPFKGHMSQEKSTVKLHGCSYRLLYDPIMLSSLHLQALMFMQDSKYLENDILDWNQTTANNSARIDLCGNVLLKVDDKNYVWYNHFRHAWQAVITDLLCYSPKPFLHHCKQINRNDFKLILFAKSWWSSSQIFGV